MGRFNSDDYHNDNTNQERIFETRSFSSWGDRTVPLYPVPEPPTIFRVLSKTSVFVLYIILILCILLVNISLAYVRVNSCSLLSDKNISINGSEDLAPLTRVIANEYQQKCFGSNVSINASNLPQGNLNGLQQVENGTIDIGTTEMFADPYQNPNLKDYQIAAVVFALAVNESVDVTNLSTDQIRKIYDRDITNWNQVGDSKEQNIVLVSRPPTSSARLTFQRYVLGEVESFPGPQSLMSDSSDTIAKSISEQPGAIGYVPLYYANKYHVKVLSIDKINPRDTALVRTGVYKFWDIVHMYTKGIPGSPVINFVTYLFSSTAKQIFKNYDYLDLADFSQIVLINHIAQI